MLPRDLASSSPRPQVQDKGKKTLVKDSKENIEMTMATDDATFVLRMQAPDLPLISP